MYAARRVFVKNSKYDKPKDRYKVQLEKGGKPVAGIKPDRIKYVDEEVMYWRKANHIHAWFVKNVQEGVDDCKSYHVPWEKMGALHIACEDVLAASKLVEGTVYAGTVYDKDHPNGVTQRVPGKVIKDPTVARSVLPTKSGFFFGSEEYDEQYLKDVEDTCIWVARMINDYVNWSVPGDIFYSSSW